MLNYKKFNLLTSPFQKKWKLADLNKLFKRRKKLIFSLLFLFFIIPIVYSNFRTRKKVEAAWWNETWLYRRAINITNSSGSNLTNFQVSFTLDTASLISAGKMQSDCDDIRITDVNGNVLAHWIEENNPGCNNSATKIWTKVPSLPTSRATIYVYYGNSLAENIENGDQVFEFFDDFNDGVFDNQKWTRGNSGTGSDSEESGVITITSGGDWWGTSDTSRYIVSTYAAGNSFIAESKINNIQASFYGRFFGIRSGSATNEKMFVLLGDSDGSHITNVYRESIGSNAGWYGENSGIPNPGVGKIAKFVINGDTATSYYNNSQTNSRTVSGWGLQYVALTDTENFGSQFDWIFIRKYSSSEPSASPSNYEQTVPGGAEPTAYWKLDEGTGTTVYDSIGTNNGTLGAGSSAPSWQTEDLCMAGKCLKFDGTDDYVGIGSTANDIKTVSFWVKVNNNTTGLIGLNASAYISVSSGTISATGFSSPTIYVNGRQSTTLETNKWQHVVVTTNTGITGSVITLGKAGSSFLQGFLDEVKLYNYAPSSSQIKADYTAGKAKIGSSKGSSVVMGTPEQGINLSEGLVGYWKMDEGIWTNDCSTNTVIDYSGNGNHGKSCPASSGPTGGIAGKFGNAGYFDGSNDSVYIGNKESLNFGTNDFSVTFWVKNPPSIFGRAISKMNWTGTGNPNDNAGWYVSVLSQQVIWGIGDGVNTWYKSENQYPPPGSYNFESEKWYLIVGVFDRRNGKFKCYVDGKYLNETDISIYGSVNNNKSFYIGRRDCSSPSYFNGYLDEVRIYNRALSPAEVRALYEWAPGPVAHFKLDDASGTSPIDSSTFGRTGSIINALWSVGKFGKGLKLDGSGDYLEINDF